MAKNDNMPITSKEKKKDTVSFNFASPNELRKKFSDMELDEELTITVSGKITNMSIHESKDWNDGSVGMDITSIKVIGKKESDNKKELDDMVED